MQPYFYPYIGYFELMSAVDVFVLFSDVQYQRRGWINRNRIRGKYLTVPVQKSPQDTKISEIRICTSKSWKTRHLATLSHTFGKQALFHPLFQHYQSLPDHGYLSVLLKATLDQTAKHLQIDTPLIEVATNPIQDEQLSSGEKKLIGICKEFGADTCVNASGGVKLYSQESFRRHGINLEFMPPTNYPNKNSILELCLGEGLCKIPL